MGSSAGASDLQLEHELDLVEAARTSPEAFGSLYDRYVLPICRFAYARTGSHQDAEDVTSETFRRALEHIDRYRWQGKPFAAWLYRIASNLIVSRHRQERAREPLDVALHVVDGDPQPHQVALVNDDIRALWALVAELPPDQRRAVVLRFGHGLKIREIAEAIGRSEGATKALLYRAIVALREKVQSEGRRVE